MTAPSYSIISFPASKLPDNYKALIFSKWLRSLRHGNPFFKKIDSFEFFKNYHKFIENLLAKPSSMIRLAVLSDDHDVVLGFAISREDVLDYIYVQNTHRNIKIGSHLLLPAITTFTHFTLSGLNIWQAKYKDVLKFNPFA